MGRTTEKVIVKNYVDLARAELGEMSPEDVRSVAIDAVVNTGASHLCLPPDVIANLGLLYSRSRNVQTANGTVKRRLFKGADVTIQGRNEEMTVMENDATTPPLIGYLLLEMLDFVVDPKSQRLIPNPAHDGKLINDMF
jgi:clan AA aspartic protease